MFVEANDPIVGITKEHFEKKNRNLTVRNQWDKPTEEILTTWSQIKVRRNWTKNQINGQQKKKTLMNVTKYLSFDMYRREYILKLTNLLKKFNKILYDKRKVIYWNLKQSLWIINNFEFSKIFLLHSKTFTFQIINRMIKIQSSHEPHYVTPVKRPFSV